MAEALEAGRAVQIWGAYALAELGILEGFPGVTMGVMAEAGTELLDMGRLRSWEESVGWVVQVDSEIAQGGGMLNTVSLVHG